MANKGKDHNRKGRVEGKGKGGETRNGRKSQFKNHNPNGDEEPNEYISSKDL